MTEHKDPEIKQEFNQNAGYHIYALMTGATTTLGLGLFSLAMYLKPDASALWAVGAAVCILAGVGGFFEVGRSLRAMAAQANKDSHPPAPKP